jgi:hypothetical protein
LKTEVFKIATPFPDRPCTANCVGTLQENRQPKRPLLTQTYYSPLEMQFGFELFRETASITNKRASPSAQRCAQPDWATTRKYSKMTTDERFFLCKHNTRLKNFV